MKNKNLALRPYLEKIEKYCHQLDHTSLIQHVLALARQVEPKNRRAYLDTFFSICSEENRQGNGQPGDACSALLVNISRLHKNVRRRLESIEDGTYWDDPDEKDWEEYYYDEDVPDLLSSEQADELSDYLSEAEQWFVNGDRKGARDMYMALFSLIDEASMYGYLPDMETDLREARARYIRCVYDLERPEKRVKAVLSVMYPGSDEAGFDGVSADGLPFLQDVIDVEQEPPKGLGDFLSAWSRLLAQHDFREERIADLMLEAVLLNKNVDEVGRLAKEWGKEQPKGYLFWLDLLQDEGKWEESKDGARFVLGDLRYGINRHRVSDYLIKAAEHLEDSEALLDGYRETFHSLPDGGGLLDLITEAGRQQKRAEELEAALQFCIENRSESGHDLITLILIMSGRFEKAFNRESGSKPVGWESGDTGLVYFSTLYLLCKGNTECSLIKDGLRYYSGEGDLFFSRFSGHPCESGAAYREIVAGLGDVYLTEEERRHYRSWCQDIADRRVSHIVSNKHRRAYARAALVLTALAESWIDSGDLQGATGLLQSYCRVDFNRFTAFRKEVREAVGRSPLMRGWGKEL